MRTEWRNVLAWGMLRAAVMMGIVIPQGIAYGQAGATFEVSRVSPGEAPRRNIARVSRTPERIAFPAALLGDVVAFAYGFPIDRVERRPQWMYDDRYDVAVTTSAPTSLPRQKLLLQKLLEERFGLVVHRTSNESPVYFLVPGPNVNLTPTQEAGAVDVPEFSTTLGGSGLRGLICVASHVSMSDLAAWLYRQLQLPVLDKTGITGLFDIEIPGLPPRGGSDETIRAVRNALGLDLELHRGTAETLIIDRVERPSEN
ncbi:MAG TPA: TIGR03435 family protein [Bryobacteraceae bacterium]|jgi:uncharacterized protein (TIGR03435 family)